MAKIGMKFAGRCDEFRLEQRLQRNIAEHDKERRAKGRCGKTGIESQHQRLVGGLPVAGIGVLFRHGHQRQDDRLAQHGEALPQNVGDDAVGPQHREAEIMGEQQPVDALPDGGDAK